MFSDIQKTKAKPKTILFLLFLQFEDVVLKFYSAWIDCLTFININLEVEVVNFGKGELCKKVYMKT